MVSGRFAISLHILTLLARYPGQYLSSEFIAGSLNVHPVLVRNEIANLKKGKLVESREGKNGGTKLLKSASSISLDTIFKMTVETVTLGYSKNEPNPNCPVGKKMTRNLDKLYRKINENISAQLTDISLERFSREF